MPYFLKHHFDPDFDHRHLAPKERSDGSVDHYDLGYVQNVVALQVLAEMLPLDQDGPGPQGFEERFVQDTDEFPAGPGTRVDPDNPDRLLATRNGYVYYDADNRIAVKGLLNVRRDVDFNTGNVAFVNNLVIHGGVRSGFRVRAVDVRVKDTVEGARIAATGDVVCESGIKGGGEALIQASGSIKAGFSENAILVAGENVLIEGAALHNNIFAGNKLAVKGRVTGGEVHCLNYAYIGGQLGGGIGASTCVVAGYDPMLLYVDQKLNVRIKDLSRDLAELKIEAAKGAVFAKELARPIEEAEKAMESLLNRKVAVWERIKATETLDTCKVMVGGTVKPGVEISIGPAYFRADEEMSDVRFTFKDNEIRVQSPAVEK